MCACDGILLRHTERDVLPLTTQVHVEGIVPSDVGQTPKDKYHMISFTCGIERTTTTRKKLIDIENRLAVARGRDCGAGEMRENSQKMQTSS